MKSIFFLVSLFALTAPSFAQAAKKKGYSSKTSARKAQSGPATMKCQHAQTCCKSSGMKCCQKDCKSCKCSATATCKKGSK